MRDPVEARGFYVDKLGFELVEIQGPFSWLKLGAQEVLLRPGRQAPSAGCYGEVGMALVLYTDNLGQSAERLRAHGVEFGAPDGSSNCLTFRDPDGNWFQLVDPGASH